MQGFSDAVFPSSVFFWVIVADSLLPKHTHTTVITVKIGNLTFIAKLEHLVNLLTLYDLGISINWPLTIHLDINSYEINKRFKAAIDRCSCGLINCLNVFNSKSPLHITSVWNSHLLKCWRLVMLWLEISHQFRNILRILRNIRSWQV